MAPFGINPHAHIDAALFAILCTLLTYGIKWIFGLQFPALILFLPTFIAIFAGFYIILYIIFLIIWNRK